MLNKGIMLCVDDERIVLDSLKDELKQRYGKEHIIELAESAEEGLEILEELHDDGYRPLVIISDWLMPGMKGDEFLIKAHELYPLVIKVMLSGQADNQAVEKAKEEANLFDFIAKPWSTETLINSIDKGLQQYEKCHSMRG